MLLYKKIVAHDFRYDLRKICEIWWLVHKMTRTNTHIRTYTHSILGSYKSSSFKEGKDLDFWSNFFFTVRM